MSHIQLATDAPFVLRLAADAGLATHIVGASLAMLAGAVAIAAKKGDRLHRQAGNVFFAAMLAMGAAAAVTSPFLPDRFTAVMGVFIVYLVATAWAVVRRPAGTLGWVEPVFLGLGVAVAVAFEGLALLGALRHHGILDGEPAGVGFVIGAVALLGVLGDWRMIGAGGISAAARTARHLWRMTLAWPSPGAPSPASRWRSRRRCGAPRGSSCRRSVSSRSWRSG